MSAAFRDDVVLITGASSGIGAALARAFAREGARLVLAARRLDRLAALATELGGPPRTRAVCTDVTVDGDLDRAAAVARQAFGRIDVVVANAGFGVVGPVERLTLDDYRRQFETNVFGVLRTIYATLADLKASRGRLVIIGSVAGHLPTAGASAYAMSKFAVRALAEALGHELAPAGVSMTLVTPGFVESEIRRVDNRGVLREDTLDPVKWLRVPADRAAHTIVRAVARRRREVVITGHGKAAVFFQRHAPAIVSSVIRRFGVTSRTEP